MCIRDSPYAIERLSRVRREGQGRRGRLQALPRDPRPGKSRPARSRRRRGEFDSANDSNARRRTLRTPKITDPLMWSAAACRRCLPDGLARARSTHLPTPRIGRGEPRPNTTGASSRTPHGSEVCQRPGASANIPIILSVPASLRGHTIPRGMASTRTKGKGTRR